MSVETDRELLELAAKAAGYTTEHKWNAERLQLDPPVIALVVHENGELVSTGWNPLDTDGHALRLAVKLEMSVEVHRDASQPKPWLRVVYAGDRWEHSMVKEYERDPYAATRRAIVRASAQIGRAMP